MKISALIIFLCFAFVCNAQKILVNEIMPSNENAATDKFGDNSDWIEIYNSEDYVVNLKNWALTDNPDKATYWKFPDVYIEPQSFLLIYASGRDIRTGVELHTNFKISHITEGVYLFNSQRELVSYIPPMCVPRNFSLGYAQDGVPPIQVLTPSPGETNNFSDTVSIGTYTPSDILFSKEPGFYNDSFYVTLTTTEPNVSIYYTLDGSTPNESSLLYTDSILMYNRTKEPHVYSAIPTSRVWVEPKGNIFKVNVLRAVAYSSGCAASEVYSKTYIVAENSKEKYPVHVVSLTTNPSNLFGNNRGIYVSGANSNFGLRGRDYERDAHMEVFDVDGNLVVSQNIGIRIHGGASRAAPQKSFRLYARSSYGNPVIPYAFFDEKPHIQEFSRLILRSARDWSYTLFKDELCHSLVSSMNIDNMATLPAVVFINGEYWGIKSFHEYYDIQYLKSNHSISSEKVDIISYETDLGAIAQTGTIDAYEELVSFLETHDLSNNEYYEQASNMVDVPNMIDFFIAQNYFANSDFPKKNLKMWREVDVDTAKWRYLFFDCDGCMIRTNYNHIDDYNNTYERFQIFPEFSRFVLRSFFQNTRFQQQFAYMTYYHLQNTFNPDVVISRIEEFEEIFEQLAAEHTLRWRRPTDVQKWRENVNMMKKFALQRPAVMHAELQANFDPIMHIYPNPLPQGEQLSFSLLSDFEACEKLSIEIYTMQGVTVYSHETNACDVYDLKIHPHLPSGMYVVIFEIFSVRNVHMLLIE